MPEPKDRLKIAIVGVGTIGSEIAKKMRNKGIDDIYTVDVDEKKKPDYFSLEWLYNAKGVMDVYILTVWSQNQVYDVVEKIDTSNHPLISIETTILPGCYGTVKQITDHNAEVIIFPERLYPNDEFHSIFNQPRIMGGDYKSGKKFYHRYIIPENIIITDDILVAELSHIVDNTIRYAEINIAQQFCMMMGNKTLFEELRRICNTKWNIDLKEAREGVGGHCLPKDLDLLIQMYPDEEWLRNLKRQNEDYKEWNREN